QATAALVLVPLAAFAWPAVAPSALAWGAAALLGVLCTGFAYLLFFRLIGQVGPAQAMTVTYLIPLFGVFWGWAVLGEPVPAAMVGWGAVILLGTAVASGVVGGRRAATARAKP
ncbi:MAG: DMT family transporter, partial [Rubrivivax sp.]|nr:DMT family transporter [Rubrivivax sp.]